MMCKLKEQIDKGGQYGCGCHRGQYDVQNLKG